MHSDDDRTRPHRLRVTGTQEAQLARARGARCRVLADVLRRGLRRRRGPAPPPGRLHRAGASEQLQGDRGRSRRRGLPPGTTRRPASRTSSTSRCTPSTSASAWPGSCSKRCAKRPARTSSSRWWSVAGRRRSWAMAFYQRQRFQPIDATAPAKVQGWKEDQLQSGHALTRPGGGRALVADRPAPKSTDGRRDGHDARHGRSAARGSSARPGPRRRMTGGTR